jgi:hypothetical protein
VLEGEIVGVLVTSEQREAVAETVDVRLTVIDRVFVGDPVDVFDCGGVSVGDLLINGVVVLNGEKVPVELLLELAELVVEPVLVFDGAMLRVLLTLAVAVLELVELDVVVIVYTGVTVPLGVLDILDEPEDVFDGRILAV